MTRSGAARHRSYCRAPASQHRTGRIGSSGAGRSEGKVAGWSRRPSNEEHRVTPRELFFDLVFVFAFTQVATLLAHEPTFTGIGHGVLVLAALWWAWTAYAWLTNTVDPEEGVVGAALLVALIAMFVAGLAVPGVFDDDGMLFGAAFLVVCAMHTVLYSLAARRDPELLRAVIRLAPWVMLGATLILVAGFTDGARTWLWLAALAVTYVGAARERAAGWQLHPSHLAERYGLVMIIALGEAFISIGIGATGITSGSERSWPRSSGSSSPPRSGSPTSTSSRSAASGCSTTSKDRNGLRSPGTSTRMRTFR